MHEVSHRSHIQARRNNSCCWCIIMCMCNNKSNQNWTPEWKLCSWLQCTLHDRHLIPNAIGSLKSTAVKDPRLQFLKNTIYNGWPVLDDGLILKADRVVVPESLRTQSIEGNTHWSSRQNQMLAFGQAISLLNWHIWWHLSMVKNGQLCNKYQQAQPKLPTRPWEKLWSDIFQFNGANYLTIIDYYSRFPIIRPWRIPQHPPFPAS